MGDHSYACLAFKSDQDNLTSEKRQLVFEEKFRNLGWEVPRFVSEMKSSESCYFNTIAQVRMAKWSKGGVALVGDAAHAASGMGTSLAIVGAYVLAKEIERGGGDYSLAFERYESRIRDFVEKGQELADSNHQLLASDGSSMKMMAQLYLMKVLPRRFIQYITERGRKQMRRVANGLVLESEGF
ncbi:MAG: hypothetical protein P0S95_03195 [Rhabdochlamydiaceae bacterium]|nr:hypothetical protein [Candidatus Amphrikana amoebophyrae]